MRFGGAAPDVRDFQEACRLATAKVLPEPDAMRNSQVVHILASGRISEQQAADVLGKRLQQKRPHKQFLAVRLIADVLEAHPDLRPALVKRVLTAQKAPMNRYSNTLQEQQRFKAAANELLQGPRAAKPASPAAGSPAPHAPRTPDAAAAHAAAASPRQRPPGRELEKALVAATATATELAHKVQDASLELANGTGSAASVQHAGKAAELPGALLAGARQRGRPPAGGAHRRGRAVLARRAVRLAAAARPGASETPGGRCCASDMRRV